MILQIEEALIDRMKKAGLPNVSGWSGKAEDLLTVPKTVPAIRVVFGGSTFGEPETVTPMANEYIEQPTAYNIVQPAENQFAVLLYFRSIKQEGQGTYDLQDSIRNSLAGYKTKYGMVIPVSQKLLFSSTSGEFIYSTAFKLDGKAISGWDESEPLVKDIKFEEA